MKWLDEILVGILEDKDMGKDLDKVPKYMKQKQNELRLHLTGKLCAVRGYKQKYKHNLRNGGKYLHFIHLIREQYPE